MPREVVQVLSPREDQILRLASEGLTDYAIAARLGISEGTVGTYWGRIRQKIGPYPRTELIAISIRDELQRKLDSVDEDLKALAALLQTTIEQERLYESVVDSADEGILILSAEGRIEYANPSALQILGYSLEEAKALALEHLIPERHREEHAKQCLEFGQQPTSHRMHEHQPTFAVDRSGREIPIIVNLSTVRCGTNPLWTCFFRQADTA